MTASMAGNCSQIVTNVLCTEALVSGIMVIYTCMKSIGVLKKKGCSMKRGSLVLSTVLLAFCLVFMNGGSFANAASWPDTVKVGIYSGSEAVASVSFNSKSGLEVGAFSSNAFQPLLTMPGGTSVIIRKDAYFIKSSSGVTSAYNPAEGKPFEGETLGPYHIQIGDPVQDFEAARGMAEVLLGNGVIAYPAFENGWYVWTGFYADPETASQELVNLADRLGSANLKIITPSNARLVVQSSRADPLMIFTDGQSKLRVRPLAANNPYVLSVNGSQYRGEFEIRRYLDSDLTVINILNIEEYLYGVVPQELEHTAPLEALKAQAVAARTYTYKNMGKYAKWGFDVVDTVSDQVYTGYDGEKAATNTAVDQTKGKKALYNGSLASLYYFSSSGGMTEDSANVWGTAVPYLKSVPDPYESGKSYNYSWTKTFTAEELKQILFLSDVDIGNILSVSIEEVSAAGRPIKLKFTGTKGNITYYRQDGRSILGLPSNYYTINSNLGSSPAETVYATGSGGGVTSVDLKGSTVVTSSGTQVLSGSGSFSAVSSSGVSILSGTSTSTTITAKDGVYVFTGKGWGHGVGMSQEGAKGFALQGYTYDQILKHYFTGITIE